MISCTSCSRPLREEDRFCAACGAAASSPSRASTLAPPPVRLHDLRAAASGASAGARYTPGAMLGARYRIVGLLGRGGMGAVYRADDLKLGRPVALKLLPVEVDRDADLLGRLLDEVSLAVRVTHANVCRVHDVGEADGLHFISMEYVDGEDLASLLLRIGRLPEDKAIQAARQLCAGLAAAHEQGILHRDLKPANVMLDGRGQVKITDFGLARIAGEIQGAEASAGTPAYMAPEQAERGEVGVPSDIYSLGLVLYELFTGRPAFAAGSAAELARLRSTPPTTPSSHVPGLDPAVERIVLRCLETDPAARPASALAVAAALPGGDPLAAALAAGETPSPELVAEAGPSLGLGRAAGALCVAGIVVAASILTALSGRVLLVRRVRLDRPPVVLAVDARDAIRSAGWTDPPSDSLYGFIPNVSYLDHLRETAPGDPWGALREDRPSGLVFAYRESPKLLERRRPESLGLWFSDPPSTYPGMIETWLSPGGKLLFFSVVPPEVSPAGAPAPDPDWRPLFAAADLDPDAFEPVEPVWSPRSFADRRFAWTGKLPESPELPVRIEAASYRGRPVSFRIVSPWTVPAGAGGPEPDLLRRLPQLINTFWFVVVLVGASLVALRNIRLGRGDRSGALRLAVYVGVMYLLRGFGVHHVPSVDELEVVTALLAWALYYVGLVYVFYLALEPYARRMWPRILVSWVRLLGGKTRDPLVGRDLLIGILYGIGHALLIRIAEWAPMALGLQGRPLESGFGSIEPLRGARHALASLAAVHVESVLFTFFGIMMFLVLRLVLGRTWAAIAIWTALAGLMFSPTSGTIVPYLISMAILLPLFWIVFFRAGLLAVIVGLSFGRLILAVPLTFEIAAWYGNSALMVGIVVTAVVIRGFRAALAGRTLFRDELAPAEAGRG